MAARTTQQRALPTLVRGESASRTFLNAVGKLWEAGVPVQPPVRGSRDLSAPLTPFIRRRLTHFERFEATPQWVVDWTPVPHTDTPPLAVYEVTGTGPLADALRHDPLPNGALVWVDPGGGSVDRAADALVFLQRVAQHHDGRPVVLVTRGASFDQPLAASVHGLIRTARLEWPDLSLRLIDIPPDILRMHAASHPSEPTLRIDAHGTSIPRLTPHQPPPATFRAQKGTWVITGGLGALGIPQGG